MSGGSGPDGKGQVIGIWTCVKKKKGFAWLFSGNVDVYFVCGTGKMKISLPEEDADYFVIGQAYQFSATKP